MKALVLKNLGIFSLIFVAATGGRETNDGFGEVFGKFGNIQHKTQDAVDMKERFPLRQSMDAQNDEEENGRSYWGKRWWRKRNMCSACKGSPCSVGLPHFESRKCQAIRRKDVLAKRAFYKLKKSNVLSLPMMDQSLKQIVGYFAFDELHAHFVNVYFNGIVATFGTKLVAAALKVFGKQDFTTFQQYFAVNEFFKKNVKMNRHSPLAKYMKFASMDYKYFTKITDSDRFQQDRYFVEARLAGMNPMAIRRVSLEGTVGLNWRDLKKKLNPTFNWIRSITKMTKKNLRKSIAAKQVYVVDYPYLDGIASMPDYLAKTKPTGKMIDGASPIAVFVSVYNRRSRSFELKVVAIQVDYKQSAKVYTPADGHAWNKAKIILQAADSFSVQIYEHLLRTHLRMEPVCVTMERHLSKLHPLYQILRFHCRGTLITNGGARENLLGNKGTIRKLFPYGNLGAEELVRRGYAKMKWNDIGLWRNIKQRGMEDRRKVPFYPYRDDGALWDKALYKFAKKFVALFYADDYDVMDDYELQNFINELSISGKNPPNNGLGKVKGLQGTLERRKDLVEFIKAIIWIPVHHSVVNTPSADYGSLVPAVPIKIYSDQRDKTNIAFMLPGATAACSQVGFAYVLASLHYDAMFDYSAQLNDGKLKDLVCKTHKDLMLHLKPELDARNAKRFGKKHLTNPYMVPGRVANSINT